MLFIIKYFLGGCLILGTEIWHIKQVLFKLIQNYFLHYVGNFAPSGGVKEN